MKKKCENEIEIESEAVNISKVKNDLNRMVSEERLDVFVFGIVIGSIILALIVVTIIFIVLYKKNRDEDSMVNAEDFIDDLFETTELLDENEKTELLEDTDLYKTEFANVIMARLVDVNNPVKIRDFEIDHELTIGRNAQKVDISFDYERTVSSIHCVLFMKNDDVYVRDMNSINGTMVDGKQIFEETKLSKGSVLRLGNLQLRFEIL